MDVMEILAEMERLRAETVHYEPLELTCGSCGCRFLSRKTAKVCPDCFLGSIEAVCCGRCDRRFVAAKEKFCAECKQAIDNLVTEP